MVVLNKSHATAILEALLEPIAELCLSNGIRFKEAQELLRASLVSQAQAAIQRAAGGEESISRISVATGLQRPEVQRLRSGRRRKSANSDVLNRVIGSWRNNKRFQDKHGHPRQLTHAGVRSQFATLVATISKEVAHYPVLFELERIGAISYQGDRVKLEVFEYIPTKDPAHALNLLSDDVSDLAATVSENVLREGVEASLHLRTSYDNIPPSALPEIRRTLVERGAEFHRAISAYLAGFDCDISPTLNSEEGKARVSVTSFAHAVSPKAVRQIAPKKRGRRRCLKD
jgi:hypothetical protein